MSPFLNALTSATLVSLISLVGIATIPFREEQLVAHHLCAGQQERSARCSVMPFCIFCFGSCFAMTPRPCRARSLCSPEFFASFVFEKFLRWKDHHDLEATSGIKPVGRIILVSDGLHNLVDGILIGASFLASREVGIATTLAVAAHELPHEIGDFGVLIDSGYSKMKALVFNFLCACIAIAGVFGRLRISLGVRQFSMDRLFPLTAWILSLHCRLQL